ncbi:MAG: KH domain-containing protein [Crinalium sp.]
MSLNKSVPEQSAIYSQRSNHQPNYSELVRFLLQPFLDAPNSLSLDCEMLNGQSRVWIRLAIDAADKGRAFGRGGRNIQAVRTVIEAAAKTAGQSVHLDIYGSNAGAVERDSSEMESESKPAPRISPPRPSSAPKPAIKSRPQFP